MRLPSLLPITVVAVTALVSPDVSVAGPTTPAQAGCRQCDEVVDRVVRLLPARPDAIVVIDADRSTPALRQATEHFEAFVTEGQPTVYLRKQGPIFRRALQGPSFWDYALACTVWHEMAHISGADEQEAQRREEQLWTQFVVSRRVDADHGLWYLQRLRKRHAEQTRVTSERD